MTDVNLCVIRCGVIIEGEVAMESVRTNEKHVAELAGPRMPADHGLASLGLLMQLGGTIFVGCMALLAVMPVFAHGAPGAFMIFIIGASGAVRSAYHRSAGTALLYGSNRGHLRPTMTYVAIAVVQSIIVLLVINKDGGIPTSLNVTAALLLLAWPLTLLVVLRSPRLVRLAEEIPVAEDLGFEGAAILMTLFGTVGALTSAIYLYTLAKLPGGFVTTPQGLLLFAVVGLLLARSILHLVAGVKGTRGIDSDGATEAASRYYSFGIVASVIAGGAFLVMTMLGGGPFMAIMFAGVLVYVLLAWPLLLRRFYVERNFAALLAGAVAPSFQRAPDAGLTALGWLLLAMSVLGLSVALPAAVLDTQGDLTDLFLAMTPMGPGRDSVAEAARSPWWAVGLAMTQLWAAIELIRMTDRYRLAATIYGAAATIVTIYLTVPTVDGMVGWNTDPFSGGLFVHVQTAITLVLPVGTIFLANRALVPTARARVRVSADE